MLSSEDLRERYADILEISKRLNIHPESTRRLIRQGKIPGAFKFGNKWLVERDNLELFAQTYYRSPGKKATLF